MMEVQAMMRPSSCPRLGLRDDRAADESPSSAQSAMAVKRCGAFMG